MKAVISIFVTLMFLMVVPVTFASGGAKATYNDWLYFLPALGVIMAAVLMMNLAFILLIVRKLRVQRTRPSRGN